MNDIKLSSGWLWVKLIDLIVLGYGKSFPNNSREPGPYAVYGSNGIVGRAHKYLIEEETIVIGRKGSAGEINYAEPKSWPIDTAYFVKIRDDNVFSLDFIYYLLKWIDPRRFIDTTTKPGLNRDRVYEQIVPLPLIPVQERIVQILQKADDIRRKRKDALELADSILSSSFIAMFGNPSNNHDRFERRSLGDLADVRSGVTKGRKLNSRATIEVPYLRVANVQDGFLDLDEVKTIKVLPSDCEKYALQIGDILMTEGGDPDKLGRGCIWRNNIDGCIHQNHIFRVRTDRNRILPEYLAALLRTQYAKHYFLGCAKRSSNLASINSTQVKAFQVPVPPVDLQEKFVMAVEQWETTGDRLKKALKEANGMFNALLHQAFSRELTAEWEIVNADYIADRQSFYERLPRLLVLSLLAEKGKKQVIMAAAGSQVTALMKYVFLLQMEAKSRRRLYQFVPDHYGPFTKEIYADLEKLQEEGFVMLEKCIDEERPRITLKNPEKLEQAISEIPDELKEDVTTIIERYGRLDNNALQKIICEKYPTFMKKSQTRRKRK